MQTTRKHRPPVLQAALAPRADAVRIDLPERFTFESHREFRAGYATHTGPAECYVVDFARTSFIDSAGLGMLMQLGEHAQNDPKRVCLANCRHEIRTALIVAGFGETATILD